MIIPLHNRLKKRMHVEIALLQDEVVELLYAIDNSLVLHGGTAIWRCYGGNRFSEDLDFYCKAPGKIENEFARKVSEHGLLLQKFKKTANLIFCKVSNGPVEIRVEVNFSRCPNPIISRYEKSDGTFIDVLILSPEQLITEKINAYNNRMFIRDIYDIYHLLSYVKDNPKIMQTIRTFAANAGNPIDEKNLKIIVYSGIIPSFKQIIGTLVR